VPEARLFLRTSVERLGEDLLRQHMRKSPVLSGVSMSGLQPDHLEPGAARLEGEGAASGGRQQDYGGIIALPWDLISLSIPENQRSP